MIKVGKQICHVDTCTRPGCSPETGCQGHAMRERAPGHIEDQAAALVPKRKDRHASD